MHPSQSTSPTKNVPNINNMNNKNNMNEQTLAGATGVITEDKKTLSSLLNKWSSSLLMNEFLANLIYGPNTNDSLFLTDHDLAKNYNFRAPFENSVPHTTASACPAFDQHNFPPMTVFPSSGTKEYSSIGTREEISGAKYNVAVSTGRSVKPNHEKPSEFKISNKDFPALPGTEIPAVVVTPPNEKWSKKSNSGMKKLNKNKKVQIKRNPEIQTPAHGRPCKDHETNDQDTPIVGIQTSPTGRITNIPSSMLCDQYGIVGQVMTMRITDTHPSLGTLCIGEDLTTFGMDLNSPENIYPTFAGPFSNAPLQPHNIEFKVPSEYLVYNKIKHHLAPIKLSSYNEDVLFYLHYTHHHEGLQIAVAQELFVRDWRYHTELNFWITPIPGMALLEKTNEFERGTYNVFDVELWRKIPKELSVYYHLLERLPVFDKTYFSFQN